MSTLKQSRHNAVLVIGLCFVLLAISRNGYAQQYVYESALKLTRQAESLQQQGRGSEALPLVERAREICEQAFGPNHLWTGQMYYNLGDAYLQADDYAKALTLFQRALSVYEVWPFARAGSQKAIAGCLNGLALANQNMGRYAEALPLFQRALSIIETSKEVPRYEVARVLNNLALVHQSLGDFPQALPLHERALEIASEELGPQSPFNGMVLDGLGLANQNMGRYAEALPLFQRALTIYEQFHGPEHAETAKVLNNLGVLQEKLGQYADALPLFERALSIRERLLGEQHPDTAKSLYYVGSCYGAMGSYSRALPLLDRALAVQQEVLGPQHPDTAHTLEKLSLLFYLTGDSAQARLKASKLVSAKDRALESILTLDERSRLSWQRENLNYWMACVLRPEPLAQLVLRWKGIVLDSFFEDKALSLSAKNDPEGLRNLKKIADLKARLSRVAFGNDRQNEASELQLEIARLQRLLSSRANAAGRVRSSAEVTVDAISAALENRALLLDFIRFDDPKLNGEQTACYGVAITGSDGVTAFVRIDNASAIDRTVDALRVSINSGDASAAEHLNKKLSQDLWQPIATQLPKDTKRLFISPDDKLNFLSFAALLDSDGSFVAEKYPIAYVGSGRDLARKLAGNNSKSLAVLADPTFDAFGTVSSTREMVAMRSAEADVFGTVNLPPLPGTKAEAQKIENIANESGWDISLSTEEEATESRVREIEKPGVLHLATHGFYLNSFTPSAEDETRGMSVVGRNQESDKKRKENGVDPMRASGVALAGAQQTLKLWSQRKAPDPETDGILTAEEVASLDLDGTWLVTLSACETGVGEARSGEGVFGLRRAFMMAGAENLLMTLWPVADDTTARIMADFYKEALATGDAPGSLAKVQRDWLVKLREEKGLAAAIREAGPFAMVMMTAPTHHPVELPAPSSGKSSWWPF